MRYLLPWLAVVILLGFGCIPLALGQPPQPPPAEPTEHAPPAMQYAVAMIATLLVLLIVCYPSRKG